MIRVHTLGMTLSEAVKAFLTVWPSTRTAKIEYLGNGIFTVYDDESGEGINRAMIGHNIAHIVKG